jgi:anaphase-promoting complex subunit 3
MPFHQPCPLPNGAAGLALLADICRKSNRKERAIKYYKMSLQLDPFLWTSFQALCELGVAADYSSAAAFGVAPIGSSAQGTMGHSNTGSGAWPFSKTPLQTIETPASSAIGGTVHRSRFETPGLTPISVNNSLVQMQSLETPPQNHSFSASMPPPTTNPMVLRRAHAIASRQYYPPSPETPVTNVARNLRYLKGLGLPPSTSEHSLSTTNTPRVDHSGVASMQRHLFTSSTSENQSSQLPAAPAMFSATNNSYGNVQVTTNNPDDAEKTASSASPAISNILELFATMGSAYQKLCQYQCREAISVLQTVPITQQVTGWVLHQQGRAYSEMNDFANAQRCLELMLNKDPGRLQGLEILSTVYWQLKKEVELAYLSQHVVDLNRLAPEAWCVVGNCFSLQKDHESALAFFKRSLQLDPDFTYTHTLSGYEYMANEDFEKAIACFRQALKIDERHYNAWYGIGAISHRQEKYDVAEYHFEKAVAINPSSSVLRCNLGIAQHSNNKPYQALETLAGAFQLDPRNPQARFQRATIYSSLQRYDEALAELEKVRDAAPREATIYFAMGKVLKRLGRPEQAMRCFLTAMDLDPKDNQMIKSAMDKLDEPDVDEETIAGF